MSKLSTSTRSSSILSTCDCSSDSSEENNYSHPTSKHTDTNKRSSTTLNGNSSDINRRDKNTARRDAKSFRRRSCSTKSSSLSDFDGSDLSSVTSGDESSRGGSQNGSASKRVASKAIKLREQRQVPGSDKTITEKSLLKRRPGRPRKNDSARRPYKTKVVLSSEDESTDSTDLDSPQRANNDKISVGRRNSGLKGSEKENPNRCDRAGRSPLLRYAGNGDLLACETLISIGADINIKDNAGWTALHEACLQGKLSIMELLLRHGAVVNAAALNGDTPLHDAAQNGHTDCAKCLLLHGADPTCLNSSGQSALDVAEDSATTSLIKIFMRQRSMARSRDRSGQTALHHAATQGTFSDVCSLILYGADVNARDNAGWTPLHEASLQGHVDVVKELLCANADPNVVGHGNDTPLHDAAHNNHIACVRELLAGGADPRFANAKGQIPRDVVPPNTVEISAILRSWRSPSTSTTAYTGQSSYNGKLRCRSSSNRPPSRDHKLSSLSTDMPTDAATGFNTTRRASTEVPQSREERKLALLLKSINKMEKREEKKEEKRQNSTMTLTGKRRGRRPKVRQDSESGEAQQSSATSARTSRRSMGDDDSYNEESTDDETPGPPAERKTSQNPSEITEPKDLPNPHRRDSTGRTQLHRYSSRGSCVTVSALLAAGADPSARDNAGWTPLHEASLYGHVGVVKMLIEAGADVCARGLNDDTPLHDAAENRHLDVVLLLIEAGADKNARNKNGVRPSDFLNSEEFKFEQESTERKKFAEESRPDARKMSIGAAESKFYGKLVGSTIALFERTMCPAEESDDPMADSRRSFSPFPGGNVQARCLSEAEDKNLHVTCSVPAKRRKSKKSSSMDFGITVKCEEDNSDPVKVSPDVSKPKRKRFTIAGYHKFDGEGSSSGTAITSPKSETPQMPTPSPGNFVDDQAATPMHTDHHKEPIFKCESPQEPGDEDVNSYSEKENVSRVTDAERYLPLYVVQLDSNDPPDTWRAANDSPSGSSLCSWTTSPAPVAPPGKALFVVDLQLRSMLGFRSNMAMYRVYPHFRGNEVTKRQKLRLWSPLSAMVSNVLLTEEESFLEAFDDPVAGPSSSLSKMRFTESVLYFVRLDHVVDVVRRDFAYLAERLITIRLDMSDTETTETDRSSFSSSNSVPACEENNIEMSLLPPTLPSDVASGSARSGSPTIPFVLPKSTRGLPAKFALKMKHKGSGSYPLLSSSLAEGRDEGEDKQNH